MSLSKPTLFSSGLLINSGLLPNTGLLGWGGSLIQDGLLLRFGSLVRVGLLFSGGFFLLFNLFITTPTVLVKRNFGSSVAVEFLTASLTRSESYATLAMLCLQPRSHEAHLQFQTLACLPYPSSSGLEPVLSRTSCIISIHIFSFKRNYTTYTTLILIIELQEMVEETTIRIPKDVRERVCI